MFSDLVFDSCSICGMSRIKFAKINTQNTKKYEKIGVVVNFRAKLSETK